MLAVIVTVVPAQTVSPGLTVIKSEGINTGIILIVALSDINVVQGRVGVAITLYTPEAVCGPKLIAVPVPNAVPTNVLPI